MFIQTLLQQDAFGKMLSAHAADVIDYLISEDVEFGVLCNLADIQFNPPLPEQIASTLKPLSLFMVAGYSFESAVLQDDLYLEFEAGFGRENFGSIVTVPIAAILQVVVNDTVIFVNLTATLPTSKSIEKKEEIIEESSESRSFASFMNNPENADLFK